MKIAHVINTLSGGGAERVAIEVFKCLKDDYENKFIIAKNIIKFDMDIEPYIIFNFKKKPFYMPSFIYEKILLKKMEEMLRDFDVVISHLRDMNVRLCTLKMQKRLNSQLIIVEHVTKDLYSQKELSLVRKFYKYADKCVAVSEKVYENLKEYGVNDIKVIENSVNIDEIVKKSKEKNVSFEGFSFLGIGRLSDDKGFDILIKAFKIANIENSNLYILGEGPKRKDLENLAKKLGIGEKVKFLGFVKNPYPYIKACNVFITSSRREAFPIATLEAMVLGKPIISTEVVPFAKDNLNALVIPKENEQSLAKVILKMYNDKNLRERLSKNALLTVQNYNMNKFCQNYKNLIKSLNSHS